MMKKLTTFFLLVALFMASSSLVFARSPKRVSGQGLQGRISLPTVIPYTQTQGRIRMARKVKSDALTVNISFLNPKGTTITDANGITYYFNNGFVINDPNLVYSEEYWGEYPLYNPGDYVPIQTTISNGGKKPAKFMLEKTAYVINPDGSNGASIMPVESTSYEVSKGATQVIDTLLPLPSAAKGLNRFVVSLYKVNPKGKKTLLKTQEGVFCPPEELQ